MERRLRIRIDYDRCVGSAICVRIAPAVFTLNEAGQSSVLDTAGDGPDKILEAAEGCPTMAILVEDAETGERLFP
ncbi:MAG: ferredoxin [Armatimonadota bacterium]|nr:ferredoxin [Armatimonadota bacterium]MDR5697474.1 ferredoxin [Armatimonadota bacterium]